MKMTAKAKAAIQKYVSIQGEKHGQFMFVLVDATLKADRMPREKLYSYLERKGYTWKGGLWTQKKRTTKKAVL